MSFSKDSRLILIPLAVVDIEHNFVATPFFGETSKTSMLKNYIELRKHSWKQTIHCFVDHTDMKEFFFLFFFIASGFRVEYPFFTQLYANFTIF